MKIKNSIKDILTLWLYPSNRSLFKPMGTSQTGILSCFDLSCLVIFCLSIICWRALLALFIASCHHRLVTVTHVRCDKTYDNSPILRDVVVIMKMYSPNKCYFRNTSDESTHYSDVIMGSIASQITSLTIVYSSVYSGADQRKHQNSPSLAFVRGIHPYKKPVTRKMFPFDDVIMNAVRQHIITWAKTDLNVCRHMESLIHNEFPRSINESNTQILVNKSILQLNYMVFCWNTISWIYNKLWNWICRFLQVYIQNISIAYRNFIRVLEYISQPQYTPCPNCPNFTR